uniref:GRAS domain-containing protein n=1 Tax=Globodera pallida TaxID=36090 RepID=A0A183C051_GLOPA
MSDNTSESEQQQQMKEISICPDVWYGVFAFVSPRELGQLMALISDEFDALVDVHFKSRKWSLGSMQIYRASDGGNGAQIFNTGSRKLLPIPQGPIPNKVIGIEWIAISYVDQTVVEFLQRIRRLFDSSGTTVVIGISVGQSRSWEIIRQIIWPLVNDNIGRLFLDLAQLDHLRRFSPTVLRSCPNLRSIASCGLFPAFPADDNADASSAQAVAKWLLTRRGDGRPKIIACDYWGGMEELKGSFVNALEPANFIFHLRSFGSFGIAPFELMNNWTGERLTLRHFNEDYWLLVRCPIGQEEAKWAAWKEANDYKSNSIIVLNDGKINGLLDENDEGP